MKTLWTAAIVCGLAFTLGAETITIKKDMPFAQTPNCKTAMFMEEDGQNAMKASGMLKGPAKGNAYVDCGIKLAKPVDLTGKALIVRIQSDTPDLVHGFYVRAYNANDGKKPVWSFNSWRKPLTQAYADLLLIPGKNAGLDWEKGVVTGKAPTQVSKFTFHAGSPKRGVEMSYKVKSIRIIENPLTAAEKFFAGLGKFGDFRRTNFTGSAQPVFADGVLKISGTTPAKTAKAGSNQYMDCSVDFAAPVNAAGKKLVFEYKCTGPFTGLHVRGLRKDLKTPCFSYSTWAYPKDWKKVEIPLLKGEKAAGFTVTKEFNGDLSKLENLSFIFCSNKLNAPLSLEIRNLKLAD